MCDKTNEFSFVPSDKSDHPGRPHSLIRVSMVFMRKNKVHGVLSSACNEYQIGHGPMSRLGWAQIVGLSRSDQSPVI